MKKILAFLLPLIAAAAAAKKPKSIYGDYAPEEPIGLEDQQAIVATLIALLVAGMALNVGTPEILFMIALVIVTFCEIITLPDALSGTLLLDCFVLTYKYDQCI